MNHTTRRRFLQALGAGLCAAGLRLPLVARAPVVCSAEDELREVLAFAWYGEDDTPTHVVFRNPGEWEAFTDSHLQRNTFVLRRTVEFDEDGVAYISLP